MIKMKGKRHIMQCVLKSHSGDCNICVYCKKRFTPTVSPNEGDTSKECKFWKDREIEWKTRNN